MAKTTIWLLAIAGILALSALSCVGSYNSLVSLDQAVQAQWGQVENVYQRRADLVPNLVETVKGAAAFEKDTLTAVTQARAQVGQISPDAMRNAVNDPQAFERFEKAQSQLVATSRGVRAVPGAARHRGISRSAGPARRNREPHRRRTHALQRRRARVQHQA
jgi:hypothetical protein